MPVRTLPPGFRATPSLVMAVVCPAAIAAAAASSSPSTAAGTPPPARPWVVKVTPTYGGASARVEIRYRHHPKPFVLRAGTAREALIRPTIRIASTGGEAWLGLDADLAWEGRCSAEGGWLVIDADRSGPGLATANLRYNFRTRRMIVSSGPAEARIDLTDGSVNGPADMVGPCRNLRDHFLDHGNQPFCVKVSDRAGCTGVVWIFDDLASVAVGPAEEPWFTPDGPESDDLSTASWPAPQEPATPFGRHTVKPLPLFEPPKPMLRPRDGGDPKWAFGRPSFGPVRSAAASSARPTPLSSWPGKGLPRRPGVEADQAAEAIHRLDALGSHWQGRAEWIRRAAATLDRIGAGLRLEAVDDKSIETCAKLIAKACGFKDPRLPAVADRFVDDLTARPETLSAGLHRLDQAIDKTMAEAHRSIQAARRLTQHAADLAEAERSCSRLAIGTSLNDEVLCLFMDLAAETGPMPARRRLMGLVAQRLLGRARDEAMACLWNHVDLLTTGPVDAGLDQPWGRMPAVTEGRRVEGLHLDAVADRALTALASTIYKDPLAARHFQRHLTRRFPNRFAITPMGVAGLVEELAASGVAAPTGLEQLRAMCGSPRRERRAMLTEAAVKVRAAWRLVDRVEKLIDRAVVRRSARLADARQAGPAYRAAYARQQAKVLALLRWICSTYADQIFGRADLTPRQRKALILATAAWWVRQWQMDLCWVGVSFEMQIKRRDHLYAWRVYDVRIDLLEAPDPEATVEERMARAPPPQAFPIGRMRLATGQVIEPRTLADIDALETRSVSAAAGSSSHAAPAAAENAADAVANGRRDDGGGHRMIVPEPHGPVLVKAEAAEPVGTAPPAATALAASNALIDPGARAGTVRARAPRTTPAEREASPPGPPAPIRAGEPELSAPGVPLSIPVTLRPGPAGQAQHLAVHGGQLARLMGVVSLGTASARPVRVWVDLHADDPAANGLDVLTSPRVADQGPPTVVELASGRWLRRAIRWPETTTGSRDFIVKFRAPDPARQPETLTMMLSLVWDDTDRPEALTEQTYVFYLLNKSEKPKLMVTAQAP